MLQGIPMLSEDIAKTAFFTDDGIYYYTRMPFRLKNVGVDFYEDMNKAFEGLIEKIVEVYVDEIIVKFKKKETTQRI